MTLLLPVHRTGSTRDRSERHPHGLPLNDSGSDARSRHIPRLAGISYPLGRPLGNPHDGDGQRAVLRAMLEVLPRATEPATYVELPFVWPESPAKARNASKDLPPAPIVQLVTRKPWLLANLYSGRIPQHEEEVLSAND